MAPITAPPTSPSIPRIRPPPVAAYSLRNVHEKSKLTASARPTRRHVKAAHHEPGVEISRVPRRVQVHQQAVRPPRSHGRADRSVLQGEPPAELSTGLLFLCSRRRGPRVNGLRDTTGQFFRTQKAVPAVWIYRQGLQPTLAGTKKWIHVIIEAACVWVNAGSQAGIGRRAAGGLAQRDPHLVHPDVGHDPDAAAQAGRELLGQAAARPGGAQRARARAVDALAAGQGRIHGVAAGRRATVAPLSAPNGEKTAPKAVKTLSSSFGQMSARVGSAQPP